MSRPTAVEDLAEGDLVDLEGDDFADPWPHDHEAFQFELAVVEDVARENDHCVRVDTSLGSFGFPVGWLVKVETDEEAPMVDA